MAEDLIRQLIEETDALPRFALPQGQELSSQNPGRFGMGYRVKSPRRYDQDMRRAHFLETLRERDKDFALNEGAPMYANEDIDALRSPYQRATADHPLMNAGRWFGSLPGAIYATGQMLANEVDPVAKPYPKAYDDYAKNMNNFLFLLDEPFGKNKNQMRDMQDMRDAQDAVPWNSTIPRQEIDRAYADYYSRKASPKGGAEFLKEARAPELLNEFTGMPKDWADLATDVAGSVMDATIDPLMTPAKTWGGLALDYGLGTAHGTVPASIEAIRRLRNGVDAILPVASY